MIGNFEVLARNIACEESTCRHATITTLFVDQLHASVVMVGLATYIWFPTNRYNSLSSQTRGLPWNSTGLLLFLEVVKAHCCLCNAWMVILTVTYQLVLHNHTLQHSSAVVEYRHYMYSYCLTVEAAHVCIHSQPRLIHSQTLQRSCLLWQYSRQAVYPREMQASGCGQCCL